MRKQHKLVTAFGLAGIFTGCLANAQADIAIDPTTQTTAEGTVVTVDVDISKVSDLYGYQFDLTFNPSILQAVSSTEGTFLPGGGATFFVSGTNDNVDGTVAATADTLLTAVNGVNGAGELAVFTFAAIGAGTSTIGIQNEILLDSNINVIPDTTTGGTVTVTSGTVAAAPEIDPASALGGLALLVGGVAVLRAGVARRV